MMERRIGILVGVLYLVLAVGYNLIAPPFESPDEVGHFFTVKYIADHGRLPSPEKEISKRYLYGQEGTQPPLYYLVGAALLRVSQVDTEDVWDYLRVNPHTTCGSPHLTGNKGFLGHDPARERFPWWGSILALHLLRFYSTVLGLATVIGVYATARLCFPGRPYAAPLAAALTALNPQFLFVSSGVNNDNLVVPLCVWSLYLMVRTVRYGLTTKVTLLMGVFVGLAALSKTAGPLLLPLTFLTILLAAWVQRREESGEPLLSSSWSGVLVHSTLAALPALILSGWWYLRNWLLYGDPALIEHHLAIVSRRVPTPLPLILREIPSIFYSYWGRFSCDLSPAGWYYAFWGLVAVVGLAGLIAGWRRLTLRQRIGVLLLTGWFSIVFAGWFRWNLIASGVQGRLLFPATVSVSVLIGAGMATPWTWSEDAGKETLGPGPPSLLAGHWSWVIALFVLAWVSLAVWVPLGLIRPAYAPPLRYPDVEALDTLPHRMEGVFGDRIALLGYDVCPSRSSSVSLGGEEGCLAPSKPGAGQEGDGSLEVTLYLSALRPLTDTYSMGLWLVSAIPGDMTRLAGLDTWPGNGNYPTHIWRPGEIVVDTYRIAIPEDVPRAQAWIVQLNFYRMGEGEWFPFAQEGQVVGDKAILGLVRVGASEPPEVPAEVRLEPSPVFGQAIALRGAQVLPLEEPTVEEHNLRVTLWWEALAPLEKDYTVFVHLVSEDGPAVGNGDGQVLGGGFPTRMWRPGDVVIDEHVVPLPPDLSSGDYTVQAGWYDPLTGARLPAVCGEQRLPQDAADVGRWVVP